MFLDRFGNWIKKSPKFIAIASLGGLAGFLLTVLNGSFLILENLDNRKRIPSVEISSFQTTKKYALWDMGQVYGTGLDYTFEDRLTVEKYRPSDFPFLLVGVRFKNPSKTSTTFMHCSITAEFMNGYTFEKIENLKSDGFVAAPDYLMDSHTIGNQYFYLQPGEVKEHDLMFFFIPFKNVTTIWQDEKVTVDPNKLNVHCTTDSGEKLIGSLTS